MQIINDLGGISRVQSPGIRQVLTQRISQIEIREGETLTDLGTFYVVNPGDTIAQLEEATGCCITSDLFGDAHYGDDDFTPSFEWLERHSDQQCFEMVFIMTDDGYFTVLFIPDGPGIDSELLSLCREYS